MKQYLLNNSKKKFFTINDIANLLSISKESAKVTANRYCKSGLLIRIKRNLYISASKFKELKESELFQIANFIEVPSYISLSTSLSYFNISTQQLQNVIESISLKRTKTQAVNNIEFRFYKVKQSFYSGFINSDNFFIAQPEKAFADSVYLTSLGKYSTDFESINFKKLNIDLVNSYMKNSNSITIKFWEKLCKRYKI
ncbi:Hypothetical protein IALB_2021 [Ignavibacterium album JCM 16511]|uniref:AbiEi antitoxin N-terminal domain-containing protein n=1 Tax=Ignavibacterium album (strain DSM 19864 / JCM 16511 / NBRC 101810 / Mat9-16) TaxID=945713 RepID=I0AL69_IGNAJ|nr:type IV toxin-antitoxin system AbiEi family antitoxin domain-containing protein [Ignavibacterium album]AFH49726.1 Hypothetical protein IALB_2021 [Ignavibacterium album JCM 16511]